MEKNCLHEDDVGKKMFAERRRIFLKKYLQRRICLKNMFAETYMFKKKCLRKNISHTPPPEK